MLYRMRKPAVTLLAMVFIPCPEVLLFGAER
jgi:hypothetical protein